MKLCANPFQVGVLAKSMTAAQKVGKAAVSTEKALSSIAKQSEISFQEAMEHQSPPTTQEIKFTDVTHTLFAKQVEDEFLPSSFCIYKGIIANLTSWGRQDQGDYLCGIMAGDGKSVLDVVVSSNFQGCISSDCYQERLSNMKLQTMGIVCWVKDFKQPLDKFVQPLRDLKSPSKTVILLVMCGGLDPMVWEVFLPDEGDAKFTRCSGPKTQSGRKKNEEYRVLDLSALSKSTTDTMNDTVAKVFQDNFKNMVAQKLKATEASEARKLQVHYVPADGFCFWHSIVGALEFDAWSAVPRKESGYSSNHRIVKNEEEKAKSLMQMTMARASGMDVDADTIANIYQSGCVEVGDLHWISNAMGISVRCTISDEARNRVLGCGVGRLTFQI